ncbi:DUF2147 domain-containing protein [Brumimicrobium glaciale]|uniref:DUF2147 domain-containing protein n=1 Tax=Brumimicrobium glaciale TaxID=200475 RepID=A0A4Q4KI34_9FLAO|nr:DUF2147 domain-containing protein [Brumimicrobium glaciale]RYM32891.1 DUF2147 domain-containing protein [Brumimicrobium glaciale]
MNTIKYFLIFLLSITSFIGFSQSVEGIWETYYEGTDKIKSDVKVYTKDGKLYAKIIKFYNMSEAEKNAKCLKCTDYRKNQPIVGMVFMNGLVQSDDEWEGDAVLLDPNNGKEYDGLVWLENENKLAVRGYLGWLYETKYWKRKS